MDFTPTWSYGKTIMRITGVEATPVWSYGESVVIFVYAAALGANVSRWLPAFIRRIRH